MVTVGYAVLADVVVVVHAGFALFVVLGGLSVARWPRVAWVHAPAVVWAVGVEWRGAICPLTPLENWLRTRAGEVRYSGDFIQEYVWSVLYPAALTREVQFALGGAALGVNIAVYWWLWRRKASRTVA